MAKYKPYSYEQGVMIPINFNTQIIEGTIEHTIHWLVDNKINLSQFDTKYNNDTTGARAYDPAVMLKIVLYAYFRGIISSRAIMRACRENIIFRALSADTQPDFTTIAHFISTMASEIKTIFTEIILVCSEMELLGGTEFALDGCKISSNASKEYSGTFNDLRKKREKIEKVVAHLMEKHQSFDLEKEDSDAKKKLNKRIEKLTAKAEKIKSFLENNEKKLGSRNRESQSNVTDNESAKMKTGHGVIQGYNGLAVVDSKHQIIVSAEAFGSGQEHELLQPMMENTKSVLNEVYDTANYMKGKRLIADTGSFCESNIEYLSKEMIDAYIPDQQFRKRDPRFADAARHKSKKESRYTKEDFVYDETSNTFTCPAGKKLIYSLTQVFNNTQGRRYISKKSYCQECNLRDKCMLTGKSKYRTLYVVEKFFSTNYSEEMKQKIDTVEGREVYSRRMGIVEPVFGNIRSCKRLDRFTLRLKHKVNIQWMLFALIHNIEKITNYGTLAFA